MIDRRISPAEVWPPNWKSKLTDGPIAIGIDPATTTKAKSNPTGMAVTQRVGLDYVVRAVVRFKTDKPEVTEAVLNYALDLPNGLRARRVVILATNERFFAAAVRSKLAGTVVVELVIESEKTAYMGEEMIFKMYLGNLLVNTIDDGHLLLPRATWLRDDIRQVKRDKGGFSADPDENGNHADAFAGISASLHGLISGGGPVTASAAQVGTFGKRPVYSGWKNPYARQFERQGVKLNA